MKKLRFLSLISILLVLWGNSSYVPTIKNVGFYCNDSSIQKPYYGDSIQATTLFCTLLIGGAIILFVTEKLGKNDLEDAKFKPYLKYYYAGFACTLGFTEFLKLLFGELRPHFISTCQPNVDHENCSIKFITDFVCTGDGPSWLVQRDIYKSFPSGHASLSSYVFIFLSVHTHFRVVLNNVFHLVWKHLILLACLVWTVVCCISRILDNRHFWWDVLAGITIGLIAGFLMVTFAERKLSNQVEIKKQAKIS